jgi:hypothetical protein
VPLIGTSTTNRILLRPALIANCRRQTKRQKRARISKGSPHPFPSFPYLHPVCTLLNVEHFLRTAEKSAKSITISAVIHPIPLL